MKRISPALGITLGLYLILFLLQVSQFILAPTFYSASLNQEKIPLFIKLSFVKIFLISLGLYCLWGIFWGWANRKLLGPWAEAPNVLTKSFYGALALGQLSLFLLGISLFYPTALSVFNFWKILPFWQGLLFFMLLSLALGSLSLWLLPSPRRNVVLRLGTTFLLPTFSMIPLMLPASLDLPLAKPNLANRKPDVLLLGFDAMNGDSARSIMDHLDPQLGRRSFTNAFTPIPATNPAWHSILSGLYPQHHKVRLFFDSPHQPLYPELFLQNRLKKEAGYASLYAADLPETSYFNHEKGFDHAVNDTIGWEAHLRAIVLNHFMFPALWLNNPLTETLLDESFNSPSLFNYDAARFFNFAFQHYDELTGPRLLALHSCTLHTPIALTGQELSTLKDFWHKAPRDYSYWPWKKPGDPLDHTPETWTNPYFVRLKTTQKFVQQLFNELKQKHYFDQHLIVFLSDHGERFVDGHEIYGGIHGYDLKTRDQTNVPLVFFHPNFKGSQDFSDPVSLIDVAPTLAQLLGLSVLGHPYDGVALLDTDGALQNLPQRPLFTESMGFIEVDGGPHPFPRISVEKLEASLTYHPDGAVTVGPQYYEKILKNKAFRDLSREPSLWDTSHLAPLNNTLGERQSQLKNYEKKF